jgi:hypothetical protein
MSASCLGGFVPSNSLAILAAIRRPSSLLEQLGRPLRKIREPRPEVQFGQGSSTAERKGWDARLALGDERINAILGQPSRQSNLSKVSLRGSERVLFWQRPIHF